MLLPAHGLAQTNVPGSLDATFCYGAGADGYVRVVTALRDGKVLLGGNFGAAGGISNASLTRLNPDGSADFTFTSPFPGPSLGPPVYTVGLLDDGRIIAGGSFTSVGGTVRPNIVRLNDDGSVDPRFDSGLGPDRLVRILAIQPDGRIVIGGEFTSVNRTNRNRVARLHTNGPLDTSFEPGTGADNTVRSVALLPTGQILIGGLFTTFNGTPKKFLARLNSNGSLDTSFPAGSGPNNNVYFVAPQPDGTMLISGDFTAVNGTDINRVARLQADGSLDPSFALNGGVLGGPVYHIIAQTNGRIVIGGLFTSVNGVTLNRIARLDPNGSLDSGFNPGSGANDAILTMALQGDGMLLAGGLFTAYAGHSMGQIARIYGDPVYPSLEVGLSDSSHLWISWPGWAAGYSLQANEDLSPADWQAVTNVATLRGNHLSLILPRNSQRQYYRLTRP